MCEKIVYICKINCIFLILITVIKCIVHFANRKFCVFIYYPYYKNILPSVGSFVGYLGWATFIQSLKGEIRT